MPGALASRPLDPAERYFLLLDRLWPMNIVAVAELDRTLEDERVRAAWEAVVERIALARARVVDGDGNVLVLESSQNVGSDVAVATAGPWSIAVRSEQCARFNVSSGPLMRLRYLPGSGEESALALVVHHAVADARTALWLLQDVLRELADSGSPSPAFAGLPTPLHAAVVPAHRWSENRSAMVRLLGELRDERDRAGPPAEVGWHQRSGGSRDPQLDQLTFSAAQTAGIVEMARAAGATVHGALSAAWLLAIGGTIDEHERERALTLTTPADLRSRLVPPIATGEPGMYVTLLSSAQRVQAGAFAEAARSISEGVQAGAFAEAARSVSEGVRARLARGEGELFYALTRPDRVSADDEGLSRFRSLIDAAPQSIAVSNTGVLEETGDPEWVRSLSFVLAPTPNQVAFAAATTYRGRLVINLASDRARVDAAIVRRVMEEAALLLAPS